MIIEKISLLYACQQKNWDTVAFFYTHIVENLCVSLGSLQFAHVPTRPCSSIMYICDDIACIVRIVSGKIIISREHFYCFHFVSFGHHRSFQHFNSRITLKTFNLPNKKRKREKTLRVISKNYTCFAIMNNLTHGFDWIRDRNRINGKRLHFTSCRLFVHMGTTRRVSRSSWVCIHGAFKLVGYFCTI